jgi:hypothetical protein
LFDRHPAYPSRENGPRPIPRLTAECMGDVSPAVRMVSSVSFTDLRSCRWCLRPNAARRKKIARRKPEMHHVAIGDA